MIFLAFWTFSVFVLMTMPFDALTMQEAIRFFWPSTSTTHMRQEPFVWIPGRLQSVGTLIPASFAA